MANVITSSYRVDNFLYKYFLIIYKVDPSTEDIAHVKVHVKMD